MPDTFTTRYGFTQPAIGKTTAWGADRNADLQTMDDLHGAHEDGIAANVAALAGKAATVHTHAEDDVDGLVADLAALASAISGKANTSHSHVESDITGLVADLAGKASTVHSHAQSDVTNLVSDLALKSPLASPAFTGNPTAPTQSAGNNSTRIATTAYADAAVAALVASAPGALDTLNELAAALGNDANFSATVTTALAGKQATSAKDQASGYAGLDGSSKLSAAQFPTPTTSTFGGVKDLAAVSTKFLTSIVNGIPVAAQPAASDVSGLAAIATSGKWSDLQNPSAALTLSMAGNASTFNHTSAVAWTLANTTAATSGGTVASSPSLVLTGHTFSNNADSAVSWALQNAVVASPITGTTTTAAENSSNVVTLTITAHSFTSGMWVTMAGFTGNFAYLNGQTCRVNSVTANTILFQENVAHGTQGSAAQTGTVVQVAQAHLSFALSGTQGDGQLLLPPGSSGISGAANPGTGWAGNTVPLLGFYPTSTASGIYGLGISIPGGSGNPFLSGSMVISNGSNLAQWTLTMGNNSVGNQNLILSMSASNSAVGLQGQVGNSGAANPGVTFGAHSSVQTMSATSGNQIGVGIGYGRGTTTNIRFEPTSGTATFQSLVNKYTINQTGGANGAVTGILVNAVETAVGGTHLLVDLQAGSGGTTSVFAINNSGVVAKYKTIATVGDGVPYQVGTADLTAQTAAKSATTLYTPTATGWYRISVYLKVTTAATTGAATSTLGGVTITYTDGTDSVAQSVLMSLTKQDGTVATTNAGNSTTTLLYGTMAVYAKTAVAIQYAIAYASDTAGQMQYAARLRCEAM